MTQAERIAEATERGTARGAEAGASAYGERAPRQTRVDTPEWLSGEWAGESISELLGDILVEDDGASDWENEEIMDAYCEAADAAFLAALHK